MLAMCESMKAAKRVRNERVEAKGSEAARAWTKQTKNSSAGAWTQIPREHEFRFCIF